MSSGHKSSSLTKIESIRAGQGTFHSRISIYSLFKKTLKRVYQVFCNRSSSFSTNYHHLHYMSDNYREIQYKMEKKNLD